MIILQDPDSKIDISECTIYDIFDMILTPKSVSAVAFAKKDFTVEYLKHVFYPSCITDTQMVEESDTTGDGCYIIDMSLLGDNYLKVDINVLNSLSGVLIGCYL